MFDGHKIYDLVIAGATNLIRHEIILNRINVFPVADGDTGTNLALTMRGIVVSAQRSDSAHKTITSIAKAALESSLGNSGLIFANYFNGLAAGIGELECVAYEKFTAALQRAARYARESVAAPQEGTILTVMQDWANSLERQGEGEVTPALTASLESLKSAVEKTRFTLAILRKHGVPDAGAKGFYFFVEGIVDFLRHGHESQLTSRAIDLVEIPEIHPVTDIGPYRFCSQFLLRTTHDKPYFENLLQGLGDSVVVVAREQQAQIHVHTDNPAAIMALMVNAGEVVSHKIDDMQLQANLKFKHRGRLAIVTDSIADLPEEVVRREDVVVLPLNLIVDGTAYLDKVTMRPEIFYPLLDTLRMNPTSAQASAAAIMRLLADVLQSTDEVIAIFVSSRMSGIFDRVRKVVAEMDTTGKRIAIIDSKLNSAAEGLLVAKTIDWRAQGLTFDQIVSNINKAIDRARIFVSVKTLKYMLRGGRVPKIQSFFLSKLDLKPAISIDATGKGMIYKKSFSTRSAQSSILRQVASDMKNGGIDSYALVYADDPAGLDDFAQQCEKIIGKLPRYTAPISPIVGLNAGRGAIAIAYLRGGA